jgi:diaminohydroxyphosphoribosylaminopyrimidine deaminase / 5-amino-6-(5-phosphoribosylamino)uracil reductase
VPQLTYLIKRIFSGRHTLFFDAYFCMLVTHEKYMLRCFELAQKGLGYAAPNPLVGAVLVYNDEIIGEGWHAQYGQAHAEVNCINSVKADKQKFIAKSVLYVSLEPCAHYGKTPPCADLIIAQKIPNVVIGCKDSFDKVNGKGIEKLLAAGVNITTGILEEQALQLNQRFFTFHFKKRPYIILKWAQTADGKIAGNSTERIYISNSITNRLVHEWRSQEAAVLVGTNTAAKDNPLLTTRLVTGKNPVRLVIDKQLQLASSINLFDGTVKTIVYNLWKDEENNNLHFYKTERSRNMIKQIMQHLYEIKLQSVIVEGGAQLLQSFIDAGLWDEARIITNTSLKIGQGLAAPALQNEQLFNTTALQTDTIDYFKNSLPA